MKRRLAVLAAAAVVLSGCAGGAEPGTGHGLTVQIPDSERPCAPDGHPTIPGARGCRSAPAAGPATPSHPPMPTGEPPPPPWTGTAAEKRFAWADGGLPEDAATITLVKGRSPRQALDLIATDRVTPVEPAGRAVRDAGAGDGWEPVVAGRLPGGWTIVVEYNGFNATVGRVAARQSAGGVAVVIYQNVEALSTFQYAVAGRKVREFDPLLYGPPWVGHRLPQERGIRFGQKDDLHPMAQSFLLAYRLTGVALRPGDLGRTAGRIGVACALY